MMADLKALSDPEVFIPLKLSKRVKISPDTFLFRFALPTEQHKLGLPIGQCIQVRAVINGEEVIRAYTPVSSDDDKGIMDLLIKVYFKNVHPSFPQGGKMSQHIHQLMVGRTLEIRGPTGRLLYHGQGKFSNRPDKVSDYKMVPGIVKKVNMIAGGSGITPMLQIVKAMLKDPSDLTSVSLLFANKSEDDILCRDELQGITEQVPHRFKLWFTLDQANKEWKYGTGFITAEMLKAHLFPEAEDTLTLICGPPPMIQYACEPNLDKLGYSKERIHKY